MKTPSLNYRDAGVDIDAGNALVDRIKPIAKATRRPGVVSGLGGFGGLFELPAGYKKPVLVSGTDGVGTKLMLAQKLNKHDTIGIDLVAMCVNDIVVTGAEPLYFLDYYATGKLDVDAASQVISGIGEGCLQSGCALIGGETAEMPGMYSPGDYDLAGFAVGIVEKDDIIDGSQVKPGQALIGLSSSGLHSNGYSLARKVVDHAGAKLTDAFGDTTLGDALLAPTRIYVKPLLKLMKAGKIRAAAHITGGGLLENLPRVMAEHTHAAIDGKSWTRPAIFDWLQEKGNIQDQEMYRTFNAGIGMVLCVEQADVAAVLASLKADGEQAQVIGQLEACDQAEPYVSVR